MDLSGDKKSNTQPCNEGTPQPANQNRRAAFPAFARRRNWLIWGGTLLLVIMGLGIFLLTQKTPISIAQGVIAGHTEANSDEDCLKCHSGAQPEGGIGTQDVGAMATIVSTHGNTGFGGRSEEGFSLGCMDCHDWIHGCPADAPWCNLVLIGIDIKVQSSPLITTGPISFTARTGLKSFDDGVSPETNRICVACHVHLSRPGSDGNPMGFSSGSHKGGDNHAGNTGSYTQTNCMECHPHNADTKSSTIDGFMPSAGCVKCHTEAQDKPGVGPAPDFTRRAVVSEFYSATHHVVGSGVVTDTDCKMCHLAELDGSGGVSNHADGYVQLSNVDTSEIYTEPWSGAYRIDNLDAATSKTLIPFCLSCHDSDGANGDVTPFSDNQTVPVITDTLWYLSSHNTGESVNSGYGCLGDGSTTGCHASAHGSEKLKLLAPANTGGGVNNVDQEEGFCYTCHDGAPAANMQTEFNRASHHNVLDSEANNIECTNCHNPHQNNLNQPLSNPDNTNLLWSDCEGERDFCLACHDGAPPAGVTFPGASNGTGYNKSQYVGSKHDTVLDGPECRACHERHGSTIYSLLTDQYVKSDNNAYSYGNGDYALCFKCHREDDVVRSSGGTKAVNAFDDRHDKHVRGENSPCIHCHDAHYAYDATEPGLIDVTYGVNNMDIILTNVGGNNYNLDTAFYVSGNTGGCYMWCHGSGGKEHKPKTYDRSGEINTADCYDCHNTAQGSRRRIIGGATDFGAAYQHLQPESGDQYIRSQDCRACHEFAAHQQSTVILKKPDCDGWLDCNETGTSYDKAVSLEPFCQGCHDGDGAQRLGAGALTPFSDGLTPITVSGHSNLNYSGVEGDFQALCFQCHESHGSPNLSFIKLRPIITGNTTPAVNVVFTSLTGGNSFDEADADDRDDICATCHSNAANPGNPMVNHVGGLHGASDERGTDCTSCHHHERDNDSTTLDGFMPDGCTDCHSTAQDEPIPATPAGGRRPIVPEFGYATHHVSGTVEDANCQTCHAAEIHRDGILQLMDADNAAISYTESAPGAFRNPSGADLTALTGFCQSCHDGDGAQRLAAPMNPFGDGQAPLTVSIHSNIDAMGSEANFQVDCVRCHNAHGSGNRAIIKSEVVINPTGPITSGPVVFTARTGADSFDEIDMSLPENASANVDDICAVCHTNSANAGFPMTYHTGGGYHLGGFDKREQDCTACHPHDTDNTAATRDGFMPGGCTDCHAVAQDNGDGLPANGAQVGLSGGRRAVVNEFGYSSHHVTGTTVTNNDCLACHNENITHMDGSLQMADADNSAISYTESYPGAFRVLTNTADLNNFNAFCLSCHDGNGAQRLGTPLTPLSDGQTPGAVSLHSNISYTDRVEAQFQVYCGQCHNAHGSSSNIYIVKAGVLVTPTGYITAGPVVFTALTGADSFDEIDSDSPDVDDICVVCHTSINDMAGHIGGNHSGDDRRGGNCASCHPHTADNDSGSPDGFMPSGGCVDCHATGQDNGDGLPAGGRRGVVAEFGNNSHHVTGTAVTDDNCKACHAEGNSGHKNGYLEMLDADTGAVYTETFPGAFSALTDITDLNNLNSFCQSCHDGDGSQRLGAPMNPFGDGQTPLTASLHSNIDVNTGAEGPFQAGCIQCHNAHSSDNRSIVRRMVVITATGVTSVTGGPVTFTARTGANSFDDPSTSNAADICAVCHINGSNPGSPMQYHAGGDHALSGGADERGNDCTACHPHDPDSNTTTLDAFMLDPANCLGCHTNARDKVGVGPDGGRRAIKPEFSDNSHHVIGAVNNSQCRVCHESELSGNNHADGLVHLLDPDNAATTYAESYPGSYRVLTNTADLTALTVFCQNCHDSDGATRAGIGAPTQPFGDGGAPITVSLHSNIDFFPTIEADFEIGCGQCHGGHSSSNLSIVKSTVLVTPTGYITAGPVVFTQTTGLDSFDENDGTETAANNIDDICVACHSKLGAMNNHEGGIHLGGDDKRDGDCTTCHSHNADTDIATKDGFMPTGGCTECHKDIRDDGNLPAGGRRDVVAEFGYTSHHVTGTAVTNDNCLACHIEIQGVNHRNNYVELVNADNAGAIYTETFPGAFRALTGTTDLNNMSAFCQSCHDGNGAQRLGGSAMNPFGDGQAPAGISLHSNKDYTETGTAEAAFETGCGQCHGSHGSNNLSIIDSGVLVTPTGYITTGPVVFTARTGANSFDETDSPENAANNADDICVTCHIKINDMTNHTGAGNHLGVRMPGSVQNEFFDQDCTQCHPHDTDSNAASKDAFMPSEGCTVCHAYIQDLAGVGPAGGRRAVMGEFSRNSHHASSVTDADCKLCHNLTNHQNGYVRLKNVDTGATYDEQIIGDFRPDNISRANSQSLAPFCLACHDSNGANGDTTPFSDGVSVPLINSALWTNSAHRTGETTNSGYGCLGDGSTTGCHDTGHGSLKLSLLAPDDVSPNTNNVNQEEGFCYTCHDGTPVSPNTQTEFGRTSRHDVNDGDQATNSSAIECVNCHNPHAVKSSERLSNPNNLTQLWAGDYTAFCITCHDGAAPTGVTFPTTFNGTGYDKSSYPGSTHDNNLDFNAGNPDGYGCRHCHDEHGETIYALLKGNYSTTDPEPFSASSGTPPASYKTGDYGLCWMCHSADIVDKNKTLGVNAFDDLHETHVGKPGKTKEETPCIHCHDVHMPYDSGEPGLINFVYAVDKLSDVDFTPPNPDRTHSNAFWLNGAQTTGYCYLECHDDGNPTRKYHNDPLGKFNYPRSSKTTTSCTDCHAARPAAVVNPPVAFAMAAGFEFNGTAGAAVGGAATAGLANLDSLAALAGPEVITGVVYGTAISGTTFYGDGINNYIDYNENPASLQIDTNILIEMELTPFETSFRTGERVIFDRGNYRVSIIPGDGTVASIAFRANIGGSEKVLLSNYTQCPIKTGRWYRIMVAWDTNQGTPGIIYIDDLGGSGEGEQWPEYPNCTDFTRSQMMQGDVINSSDGPFTVGANTGTKDDKFSGLIDWLRFYFKAQGSGTPIYLPMILKDAGG